MRIAVVGAGGVGGYFGTRLAEGGNDVRFVARGRHLAAVHQRGHLLVHSPLREFRAPARAFVSSIAELDPVDIVLVALKLWDTEEVAAQLRAVVDAGAMVISLQNGVEKEDVLRRRLSGEAVLGGVCYVSASIREPGVIAHHGPLERLVLGTYDPQGASRVRKFLNACVLAGIDADIADDIERVVWEKFVFLVGLSGSTSLVRQPIGVVRSNPGSRSLLLDLMAEAATVGRGKGVRLATDLAEQQLALCDSLPETMTSSLHHDLQQGNRLELPWLSAAVADLAVGLGLSAPRNRTVADALAPYLLGRPIIV